eukprot:g5057.t1
MASATQTLAALEQESKSLTGRLAALAADEVEQTERLEADRSGSGVTICFGIGEVSVSVSSSERGTGCHDLTWVKSTAEDGESLQMLTEMQSKLHKLLEDGNGSIEYAAHISLFKDNDEAFRNKLCSR